MSYYTDKDDRRFTRNLRQNVPEVFESFAAFSAAAMAEVDDGIPRRYKELIALGVAFTTQCVYCIEGHIGAAKESGASEKDIAETVMVAAALRAGAAVSYGRMGLKFALAAHNGH